ncbi:MAG: lamin tail domain-containing protein, partial [Bacteroidia bacterium]
MFNKGLIWLIFALCTSCPLKAQLLINELMAAQDTLISDGQGEYVDWIEIYNAGPSAVNLDNWFLTDDSTQLAKWSFPSLSLAAGAYLIVYASDKYPTNLDGALHTNFILNKAGEYLALVRPHSSIEFAYDAYPEQQNYHSFGLLPGTTDPQNARILELPSPGTVNSEALYTPIDFSVESRYFLDPFSVTLGSPVPQAEIRYTTDDSEPSMTSPLYTGAISISIKTTLKAKLFYSGGGQSET